MKFNVWTILMKAPAVGMLIFAWLQSSTKDGKITLTEIIEVVSAVIQELGLNVQIELPSQLHATMVPQLSPAAQERVQSV